MASNPRLRRKLITLCAMTATIMQALDTTIANVALPYMQGTLLASHDQINWVLTSYIVAAAIMTTPVGWLADRFGRKRLFVVCSAGFTFASLLCASAQTIEQLVLYRLLQGVFGAALVPLSQAVMLDSYSLAERNSAMAIWSTGVMMGPIMGPTLGGWLTDSFTWHWVFLVNLPVGIFTTIGLMIFLNESPTVKRNFDWFGFTTLAVAIGALQLMLDRGEQLGWFGSTEIVVELIVALVAFYYFLAHSLTTDDPFVRFALFKDRNFVGAVVFMGITAGVLFGTMALVTPFMQNIMGYPIVTSGLILASRGVGTLACLLMVTRLMRLLGARWLIFMGLTLLAVSLTQMVGFTDMTSPSALTIASLIQGIGVGFVFVPITTVAFASLRADLRTDGTAMLTLARNIASSAGISVVIAEFSRGSTVTHARLTEYLTPFNDALRMPDVARTMDVATDLGRAMLDAIVVKQAAIISYSNDFKLLLVLTLCAMPLVFFIGSIRAPQGADKPAHAAE